MGIPNKYKQQSYSGTTTTFNAHNLSQDGHNLSPSSQNKSSTKGWDPCFFNDNGVSTSTTYKKTNPLHQTESSMRGPHDHFLEVSRGRPITDPVPPTLKVVDVNEDNTSLAPPKEDRGNNDTPFPPMHQMGDTRGQVLSNVYLLGNQEAYAPPQFAGSVKETSFTLFEGITDTQICPDSFPPQKPFKAFEEHSLKLCKGDDARSDSATIKEELSVINYDQNKIQICTSQEQNGGYQYAQAMENSVAVTQVANDSFLMGSHVLDDGLGGGQLMKNKTITMRCDSTISASVTPLQEPLVMQNNVSSNSTKSVKSQNYSLRRQTGVRKMVKIDRSINAPEALVEVPVEFSDWRGKKRPLNEVTTVTAVGAVKLPH